MFTRFVSCKLSTSVMTDSVTSAVQLTRTWRSTWARCAFMNSFVTRVTTHRAVSFIGSEAADSQRRLCLGHSSIFTSVSCFSNAGTALWNRCYYAHFSDKGPEPQRNGITCPTKRWRANIPAPPGRPGPLRPAGPSPLARARRLLGSPHCGLFPVPEFHINSISQHLCSIPTSAHPVFQVHSHMCPWFVLCLSPVSCCVDLPPSVHPFGVSRTFGWFSVFVFVTKAVAWTYSFISLG